MADTRRTSGMIKGATTVHPDYNLGAVKFAPFSQPILSKPSDGSFTGADSRPVNGQNMHAVAGTVPFNTNKARNKNYDAGLSAGIGIASRNSTYAQNPTARQGKVGQ